jgi:hypothetical protein
MAQHRVDPVGQRLRQHREMVIHAQEVLRIAPRQVLTLARRGDQRPEVHPPGTLGMEGLVFQSAPTPVARSGPQTSSTSSRIGRAERKE